MSLLLAANAAMLALVLVVLLSQGPSFLPAAFGQSVPAGAGSSPDVTVVPAQMSANTWGCYIVDKRNSTICAYQYLPGDRLLKLQAARAYAQDLQLANFNTSPSPQEVRDLVDKEQKLQGKAPGAAIEPPVQTGEK
jgi:hypothetical protein